MDIPLPLPMTTEPSPQRPSVARDLALVVAVTFATFVFSATFEVREWLTDVTRPLEPYQIDELPMTIAALAIALTWFAWRRWQQSEEELRLRMVAQRAVVEREDQYRTLFMENLAGNTLTRMDGAMQLCNPALARMLSLASPDDARGRNLGEFYAHRALWDEHRAALAKGEKLEIALLDLVSARGAPVKVIARMLPRYSPGKTPELQVYFADISELQLIQKELAQSLNENRLLSQKYLQVQEEERRNLARELHDELGQCLNAIKLDAVSIRELVKGKDTEIETSANAIVEISNHVYDVVRSMMQRLRPAALDALGLLDAVGEQINQWRRRNAGVECQFEAQGEWGGLGEVLNITVYRLVQECLTNITKHADATRVSVTLARTASGEVHVSVRDNGRGMQLSAKRNGLGLVGLRERVEALSGRLDLISKPGAGLHVSAVLPVAAAVSQGANG